MIAVVKIQRPTQPLRHPVGEVLGIRWALYDWVIVHWLSVLRFCLFILLLRDMGYFHYLAL